MPKSRNTRAKKVQSEKDRFIRLFAFCCYGWKAGPYTYDVDDAYTPAVTDFTKDLKEEYSPTLEFTNIKLEIHHGEGIPVTKQGHEYQTAGGQEYPDDLNPFADDEPDQIGDIVDEIGDGVDQSGDDVDRNDDNAYGNIQGIKERKNSIDDYPKELNPFAEDE